MWWTVVLLAYFFKYGYAVVTMASNSHVLGGRQQVGITSLGDCFRACSDDANCLGLDFNSIEKTCWFHYGNTVCGARMAIMGVTTFRFTSCPLTSFAQGVTSFPGQHVRGGTRRPGVTTIEGCVAICAMTTDCQGFDFDTRDNSCWTHTSTSECNNPGDKPFCTHYRTTTCSASTVAPVTAPPIGFIETFRNTHVLGGTLRSLYTSLTSCYEACWRDPTCLGFDWNGPNTQCWFHTQLSVCNPLTSKNGCSHYRLRANCAVNSFLTCSNITFSTINNAHRFGGQLVAGSTSNNVCQLLCKARADCLATDYDKKSKECYLISSTGIPIDDDCCIHSIKHCQDVTTTLIPTQPTTPMAPTTTPTVIESSTIADSGKCPAEFQKFLQSSHSAGNPVPELFASTPDECKQFCLDTVGCVGVDYDHTVTVGTRCFFHTAIVPGLFMDGSSPCCTHFRRINCEEKQCYIHSATDFQPLLTAAMGYNVQAFLDAINIRPGGDLDPPLVDCPGACVTETTLTYSATGSLSITDPYIIERTCDLTVTPGSRKSCVKTQNSQGQTVMECSCYGDRCNAFGMTLLNECQAYFPLDCSVEDLSQANRPADTFVYPNIKFDSTDAKKNWSAIFDGSAYIEIKSFANFYFGSVGSEPDYIRTPSFSMTMWLKRTSPTGRQVIISNGPTGGASVELSSNGAGTSHMLMASFRIGGNVVTASAPSVPLNQWVFVVAMVSGSPVLPPTVTPSGNFYVLLFVDDVTMPAAYVDTGLQVPNSPTDPAVTIDTSSAPLCIGKQYQTSTFAPGDFFIGGLDELWFFSTALTQDQMESVKGVSQQDPNKNYLP